MSPNPEPIENLLLKDRCVLLREMGVIAKQTKEAQEHLESIKLEYSKRMKGNDSLKIKLDKEIQEKIRERDSLSGDVQQLRKDKEETVETKKRELGQWNSAILQAEGRKEIMGGEISSLGKKLESVLKNIENNLGYLKSLDTGISKKLATEKELEKLDIERKGLIEDINALVNKKEEYQTLFRDTIQFREEVEYRGKELEQEKREIDIMHARLKSKYIKVFKQYANI